MNIDKIPYQAFPSIGYAINMTQAGKTSVPVSPAVYIYSHFKHVSGVPAPDGVSGVNINKLKIIDTLIEQLSRMKQQTETIPSGTDQDNEKRINTLIDQYQNQIRTFHAANVNNPYAAAAPLTGMVFNISI
jgi:hypothetical protein